MGRPIAGWPVPETKKEGRLELSYGQGTRDVYFATHVKESTKESSGESSDKTIADRLEKKPGKSTDTTCNPAGQTNPKTFPPTDDSTVFAPVELGKRFPKWKKILGTGRDAECLQIIRKDGVSRNELWVQVDWGNLALFKGGWISVKCMISRRSSCRPRKLSFSMSNPSRQSTIHNIYEGRHNTKTANKVDCLPKGSPSSMENEQHLIRRRARKQFGQPLIKGSSHNKIKRKSTTQVRSRDVDWRQVGL